MNDYAIEDAALERERLLVEGIHANATRLYDFVVALTTNAATPPIHLLRGMGARGRVQHTGT